MFKKLVVMILGSITVAGISAKAHEAIPKKPAPVASSATTAQLDDATTASLQVVGQAISQARIKQPSTTCIGSYLFLRTYSKSSDDYEYSQIFNRTRAVRCKSSL